MEPLIFCSRTSICWRIGTNWFASVEGRRAPCVDKYGKKPNWTCSPNVWNVELFIVDWDIKNSAGVPVAGGMYLIHIEVPEIGEKIIKWYGVTRPTDLGGF